VTTGPRLKGKVRLAFASAMLTLLVVGIVAYRTTVLSKQTDRRVRHSYEVLENLQGLLLAITDIE